MAQMQYDARDVAPGLWIWRVEYPDWHPDAGWEPAVTSICVSSGGQVAVIDAMAPPGEAAEIWGRLDANPPTLAVVLKPDHVRDIDVFVERYGVRALAPPPGLAARPSSGPKTPKSRSWSRSSREAGSPAGWKRSTTDAAATRRRS